MYRQRRLTVAANTQQISPASTKFEVPAGLLNLVTVEFPAGVHGLVYFQLMQSNTPIMPDEPDTGITGNNVTLQIPVIHTLERGRTELTLKGWSPGSVKSHVITVGVGVLSEIERSREEDYLKSISDVMGKIGGLLQV